jgi:hypothetical protein
MGEALVFILQRFYFSFGPGCIIIFYVLSMLFYMGKVEFLHDRFQLRLFENVEFSTNVSILIFIFSALIIGVFMEGINHVCTQYYKENKYKLLKQNGKLNFIGRKLFFFSESSVGEACRYYWREDKREEKTAQNSHFKFMYSPDTGERFDENEVYSVMRITVLNVVKKTGSQYIYRFKELSHMSRAMSFSFLLILLFSLLAMFYDIISLIKNVCSWCSNARILLLTFYLICSIISVVLMKITTLMAWAFSKRYVWNIGELYEALGLHQKSAETEGVSVGRA